MRLYDFVTESNRIEGIHRPPTDAEIELHEAFLALDGIRVADLENFVWVVSGAKLRRRQGMDVRVGSHFPEPGGYSIEINLRGILEMAAAPGTRTPWELHALYEKLHPFMDGNGRSGRALWAWMRLREGRDPFALGFLHSAYYEALEASR